MKIGIVVSSYGKQCGINEWAKAIQSAIGNRQSTIDKCDVEVTVGSLKSNYDAILIEFDYGFYPDETDLETEILEAKQKAKIVALDVHTVLRMSYLDYFEELKIVKSPFMQTRTTNAITIPHFIYPINRQSTIYNRPDDTIYNRPDDTILIGTFGFATPARRMQELLKHCKENAIPCRVLGSINTSGNNQEKYTTQYAKELKEKYPESFDYGFFTHDYIIEEMSKCSHLIFPRDGDPTISVSGAVHLAYNAKRPIIVESKAMAPELKGLYVSTIDKLSYDKLSEMVNIPSGGLLIDDYLKQLEITLSKH